MQNTLKYSIITILTFSLWAPVNLNHVGPLTAPYAKKCNQALVNGYGLRGLKKPKIMNLSMCPLVTHSCCQPQDQLTMYANWVHSKEKHDVSSKIDLIHTVFDRSVNLMIRTSKLARKIAHKLKNRPISNCGLLAKKILLFELEASGSHILKSFQKMKKFFLKSYEGFYCAICDHKNHLLFDMDERAVYYSINFCRATVESTLIPALYMNIHFKEMLRTMTRFVTSCDFKGTFTRDLKIPAKFQFEINPKIAKSLNECRDSRNKPAWFVECEPLCREMRLTTLSEVLVPSVERIAAFNHHLDAQLKRINNESRLRVISAVGGIKQKKAAKKKKLKSEMRRQRILEEGSKKKDNGRARLLSGNDGQKETKKKGGKTRAQKKREKNKKRGLIYFTQKGSVINTHTKYDFIEKGLNLVRIGNSTIINTHIFDQVKLAISMKKLGKVKAKAYGVRAKKSGLFSSVNRNFLGAITAWAIAVLWLGTH